MLDAIERAGFDGWVSPEYLPLGGTEASLGWLGDWGYWANTLFAVHKELQTARCPFKNLPWDSGHPAAGVRKYLGGRSGTDTVTHQPGEQAKD